jgi:hypothetical protein
VIVKFCNKVAKKLQEDYPNRELYVHTFSYHETAAPVTAYFEELTCEPNVTIMLAPIRANYTKDFDDFTNQATKESMEALSKFCSHITFWGYDQHYHNVFLNYNTFTGRIERYKKMDECNVGYLLDQGHYQPLGLPSFVCLKRYLTNNLSWDASLDYEGMIDEFFVRYFGDAAGSVREYFDMQTSWTKAL